MFFLFLLHFAEKCIGNVGSVLSLLQVKGVKETDWKDSISFVDNKTDAKL